MSAAVGAVLEFDTAEELRHQLVETYSTFEVTDSLKHSAWLEFGLDGKIEELPFDHSMKDFYMTDPISRSSKVMAECSEIFGNSKNG